MVRIDSNTNTYRALFDLRGAEKTSTLANHSFFFLNLINAIKSIMHIKIDSHISDIFGSKSVES